MYKHRLGICMRHGAKKKLCSFEGCTNQSEECARGTRQRQMYKQSVQGMIVYEAWTWSKGKIIMQYRRMHKSRQERRHLQEAWSKESTLQSRRLHKLRCQRRFLYASAYHARVLSCVTVAPPTSELLDLLPKRVKMLIFPHEQVVVVDGR
jgi:hypothetical protein